jgi:SOS-response transcriptional repressors (RecA-mediated autopeptidases)
MSNKKKMEVLYFVEQYIKRYGYPPTVRDIGKGLGYRSPSTVHDIFGN